MGCQAPKKQGLVFGCTTCVMERQLALASIAGGAFGKDIPYFVATWEQGYSYECCLPAGGGFPCEQTTCSGGFGGSSYAYNNPPRPAVGVSAAHGDSLCNTWGSWTGDNKPSIGNKQQAAQRKLHHHHDHPTPPPGPTPQPTMAPTPEKHGWITPPILKNYCSA